MLVTELRAELDSAVLNGYIRTSRQGDLTLYCYTDQCVYNCMWNDVTKLARGLILSDENAIIARPFEKFFNAGELGIAIPDLPFETYEKLDGSLIIIYWHNDRWNCATKGSLNSTQAQWAQAELANMDTSWFQRDVTYLAEAIYHENKIVVPYNYEGLVLLGARIIATGEDIAYDVLYMLAQTHGWRIARRYQYSHISELLAQTATLPATAEGFVIRFLNGLRLKIKGDEYCRIHRLISKLTPLAMWEALATGDDMELIRKELPEEFWHDFDRIVFLLRIRVQVIVDEAMLIAARTCDMTDKEVGLMLHTFPEAVRSFIFPARKYGSLLSSPKSRAAVFRAVRPTGNRLEGYVPSGALMRIEEAA